MNGVKRLVNKEEGKDNMSKVKMIPQKYIDKIIENNPNVVLISTEYINEDTELKFHCKKHNIEYCQTLKNALRRNGCLECRKAKKDGNFKKMAVLKNPHIEILGEYTKQGCKILCRCLIHNIEFSPNSVSLLQGKGGCPICNSEHPQRRKNLNI